MGRGRLILRRAGAALSEGPLGGLHARLFLFTLLMIGLCQAVYLLILHLEGDPWSVRRLKMARYLDTMIAEPLRGRPAADAASFLAYHNGFGPQIWLESPEGRPVAGVPVQGLGFFERAGIGPPEVASAGWTEEESMGLPEGVLLWRTRADWETGPDSPLEVMAVPVELKEGPGRLLFTYWNGRLPWHGRHFWRGSLAALAAALSWAVARRLVKPLSNLRAEVLAMDGQSPGRRVTVEGPREVADVARSVNALAESLERRDGCLRDLMASVSHELRSPLTRLDFALTFMGRGLSWARRRLELAEAMGFRSSDRDGTGEDGADGKGWEETDGFSTAASEAVGAVEAGAKRGPKLVPERAPEGAPMEVPGGAPEGVPGAFRPGTGPPRRWIWA